MKNDTIAALATPPGTGGIAVIRISGPEAKAISDKCFSGKTKLKSVKSHTIHYGRFYDGGQIIDTVLASVFTAPNSYTAEDIVEISCHGGVLPARQIVNALIKNGARHAEPGEFTKRAFLNGKLDLTQAEAAADLIHSVTIPGAQTAARQAEGGFTKRISEFREKLLKITGLLEIELDFAEEGISFTNLDDIKNQINMAKDFCESLGESYEASEILRSGYYVGIAGYPNSGKSTLFNALLEKPRAIVSSVPGTTRDYIEESLILGGIPVRITDTAGLRESEDIVEIEGIKLVDSVLKRSNMILIINDASFSFANSDSLYKKILKKYSDTKVILLQNKIDLIESTIKTNLADKKTLLISAKKARGLDQLKEKIKIEAEKSIEMVQDVLINRRHAELLKESSEHLSRAVEAIDAGFENEIISIDIKYAAEIFGKITGENFSEEALNNIFSRFCIGK